MNVTSGIDTRELVYDCLRSFLIINDIDNEHNEYDVVSQA